MISVTRRPDDIMLSGNPMMIELLATTPTGGLVVERGGTRARIISLPGQGLPENTSLSLFWETPEGASYQVSFHTDGPFPSAYEIPEYTGGPLNIYWAELSRIIGDNIDVSPWFYVYSEQNTDGTFSLWAIARSTDPAWSVRFLGGDDGSVFGTENNLAPRSGEDFRVRCDIIAYLDEGYRVVSRVGARPDGRSRVAFDISDILRNAQLSVLDRLAIPAFGTAAPFSPSRIMDYYLRIAELSEEEGYNETVLLKDLRVFQGGVAYNLNAAGNFLEQFELPGKWLTSRPDRRRVGTSEPVYLSSILRVEPPGETAVNYGAPHLELETTDYLGNTTSSYLYEDLIDPAPLTPVTWPVGAGTIGVGAEVSYYRVRVVQVVQEGFSDPDAEPVRRAATEWRTFIVDRVVYESERYLSYLNSFFTVEVLRCVGRVQHSIEAAVETTTMVRDADTSPAVPDIGQWNAKVTNAYTYATGYKERKEVEAVTNELYRSPRLYEITPTGYTPLIVRNVSFPLSVTGQNLHSSIIRCGLALEDMSYSNLDGILSIPAQDYWASPDGEAWLGANEEPWI